MANWDLGADEEKHSKTHKEEKERENADTTTLNSSL